MYKVTCKWCGKLFYSSDKDKEFCSMECYDKCREDDSAVYIKCERCGRIVRRRKIVQKYCSMNCSRLALVKNESDKIEHEVFEGDPWDVITIFGAGSEPLEGTRRPDFILGY